MIQSPERPSHDRPLLEQDISPDPFEQFQRWYDEIQSAGVTMPHAMVLATASASGLPSARVVLMKEYSPRGFLFFTNYGSRKGSDLAENPHAALTFHWESLERQVRIEGTIAMTDPEVSDEYFKTRPRVSQISAVVSSQSKPIESRQELEQRADFLEKKHAGEAIPRPARWGGYVVRPESIEFWQGRTGRLHDRILYELLPSGAWAIRRLQP